jgi:transcriptional regulator with XRE-family HTH domain
MNTNKIVGSRIKALREARSIGLGEMAERSGLEPEQIHRIESDEDFPSLAPLIKIARVLGVRLGTFLDDHDEAGPVISRKENQKESIRFSNNQMVSKSKLDYYSLSPDKSGRHMEPFIIQMDVADEKAGFALSSHEGEEFIYCLEGNVEITYGNSTYLIGEGDSIYYDSIVAHHVHPAHSKNAKILAVIYTPI